MLINKIYNQKEVLFMEMLQLEIMRHLAETLSFSATAEMLHITQPAVTYHLKKLEDELGIRLFERNTHGTALTEAGSEFYQYAADICNTALLARHRINAVKKGNAESVHIGAAYGCSPLIPAFLKKISENFKDAQCTVTVMTDQELTASVSTQECDVYMGASTFFHNNKHYNLIERGTSSLKLFLPEAAAERFDMKDWSSLNRLPYLSIPQKNAVIVQTVESIMRNHNFYPSNIIRLNDTSIILEMVSSGTGFAIFGSIFESLSGFSHIRTIEIPDEEATYRICAAIRNNKRSELLTYIAGLIRQENFYRGIINS